MKINQKELSRSYSYLNGKYIEIYVGVKKSPLKMIVYDLSITDKSNDLVKYDKILVKIVRTNFNGTYVTLFIDNLVSSIELIVYLKYIKISLII